MAAIVALALYRLLSHTSGLDLGVGWATVGVAFGVAGAVVFVVPAVEPDRAAAMALAAGPR